jgi:hypothetical protein
MDDGRAGLDRGIRATVAEVHVHRALLNGDPSAIYRGGNSWYRDHEVFDGEHWIETKAGWFDRPGLIGFSPVNWLKAREAPTWLSAVAVVPLRPGALQISLDDDGFKVTLPRDLAWYLVPAPNLFSVLVEQRRCRQAAPIDAVERFVVDRNNPLTKARLRDVVSAGACRLGTA